MKISEVKYQTIDSRCTVCYGTTCVFYIDVILLLWAENDHWTLNSSVYIKLVEVCANMSPLIRRRKYPDLKSDLTLKIKVTDYTHQQ